MRQTSINAYSLIVSSGLVNASQQEVWKFMAEADKGFTGTELDRAMARPDEANASYHKRLSELEGVGLVVARGERPCTVTGMMCIEWFHVDGAPKNSSAPAKRGKKLVEQMQADFAAKESNLQEQIDTLILINEKLREKLARYEQG